MGDSSSLPKLSYVYRSCNDAKQMRQFYKDIIGFKEVSYNDGKWFVCSSGGGTTLQFWQSDKKLSEEEGWSWQPGNWVGESRSLSWAIEVDGPGLQRIYDAAKAAGIKMYHEAPVWSDDNEYWGLKLKDPMGFTIDLHYTPGTKPASTQWPGK